MKTKTIIAIDPGTRYWGVTVLEGKNIVISIVKTFSTKDSTKHRILETKKFFLFLLEKYNPHVLVIEKPFYFWSKQSNCLNKIIEEVKSTAKEHKMKVYEYSPRTVRKAVCNDGNVNKQDAAKVICSSYYPELKIYLNQSKKYKELYWGHMFDSVGLGICHFKKSKMAEKQNMNE